MVQIEYQLTFEEFREAMQAVRAGLVRQIRRRSRGLRMVILTAIWVAFLSAWLFLWPRLIKPTYQFTPRQDRVAEMTPHLFWLSFIFLSVCMLMILIRRQVRSNITQMWDSVPHLHQRREVQFDEEGVALSDALIQSRTRWPMYQRMVETKRLMLLYTSDYAAEIYPKRAFADESALAEFRELVESNLNDRRGGFPVQLIPPSPSPPASGG